MRNPFRKGYEITMNRVHDTVTVREGGDKLTLIVNGDAQRMVAGLTRAQRRMKEISEGEPSPEQTKDIALFFAGVIFGNEQAEKLMHFYADDPGSVISICGKYFRERLADKITAMQKKMKL